MKIAVWESTRKLISSITFAVTILSLITIASIIGTIIPQNLSSEEYLQRYGERFYALFKLLDFTNLYHSWWFVCLLISLVISLAVVTAGRFSFRLRALGFVITHASIIVIVIGAIIGAIFGEKGFLWLKEGETSPVFYVKEKPRALGFEVKLLDFNLEYYGEEKQEILVGIKENPHLAQQAFPVITGKEFEIKDSPYRIKILRYLPDFIIDMETKQASSRSDAPNNPAIKIAVSRDGGDIKEKWLFAKFPDMHMTGDEPLQFAYNFTPREIKDYKSRLEIRGNGEIKADKIIEVNHPLQYKGYTFYQASYRPEDLTVTGLEIVKDPGITFVYTGFTLLMVGLIFLFYISPFLKNRNLKGA